MTNSRAAPMLSSHGSCIPTAMRPDVESGGVVRKQRPPRKKIQTMKMLGKAKPILITALIAIVAVVIYNRFIQPRVSVLPPA